MKTRFDISEPTVASESRTARFQVSGSLARPNHFAFLSFDIAKDDQMPVIGAPHQASVDSIRTLATLIKRIEPELSVSITGTVPHPDLLDAIDH